MVSGEHLGVPPAPSGAADGQASRWNFFVSYTSADRCWAEWIAWQLEAAGYTVLFQAWDFVPGSHWTSRMDEGVCGAQRTLAVLSNTYLRSVYGREEWEAALRGDPRGFERKLIPVRVEDCPRPGLLHGIVSIDLFGLPAARAKTHLLNRIRSALAGRDKPVTEPIFPGQLTAPAADPPAEPPVFPGETPSLPIVARDNPDRTAPVTAPVTAVGTAVGTAGETDTRRGRWNRRLVLGIAGGTAAALAVALAAAFVQPWSFQPPPQQLGNCQQIDISTALEGGSYHRYGRALGDLIQRDFPGTTVILESTAGSAANLDRLGDPAAARCRLAVAQLNVAVDATNGVYQFSGNANERLRTVGPLGTDILQLVVRADSPVTSATDLCGKTVTTPPQGSGTEQLAALLFRHVEEQAPECHVTQQPREIADSVADLRAGELDAMMFAAGTSNRETRDAHTTGTPIRLIPIDGYLDAVQDDWDEYYRSRLGPAFVPGDIFFVETIGAKDYPGLAPTRTISVPNGVLVDEDADPDMVRFVAEKLFSERAPFEQALWDGAEAGRPFPDARTMLTTSPLYCMARLHAAAAAYYQTVEIHPPCG